MLIDSKNCKIIRPDSYIDSDNEQYEFYLRWQGIDGGIYNWLFEDFTAIKEVSGTILNKDSERITKLIESSENSIIVTAEDLTENQFNVISEIVNAKIIRRYYKDNTYENVAIITSSYTKNKSKSRYNFEIEIQLKNSNILS